MADESATIASPASEPSSTPATPAVESAAPSPSPAAEPPQRDSGSSPKETLLDAVLKVVPASTEQDVLAEDGTAHPEAPDDKAKDGTADAAPEEDDDTEPPADAANAILRKKIGKLLTTRAAVRKELRETSEQLEAMRPAADVGAKVKTFAEQHDLSGDDVAFGLRTMAALRRGDWKTFYEAVAQPMRHAQEYLGLAIPRDLRDRVAKGEMTEPAAREFARLRMDQQRGEVVQAAEQQLNSQRALAQTQDQVNRSVSAYEERLAANDPDYKAKATSVKRIAQAMLQERGGTITTVEEALAITKAAYEEANATLRKLQPQPHATGRVPNGNGQTRSARPEPTTLYEAALQGLERSRNGASLG